MSNVVTYSTRSPDGGGATTADASADRFAARPTVAVVPAAGLGTRLRPLTDAIPKEMLPVGRRLALERIIDELRATGIERIIFIVSPVKEPLLRRYFGDATADGAVRFAYALQPEMRGLGDAVLRAEPLIESGDHRPFVIALGDAVFEEKTPGAVTGRLVEAVLSSGATVGIVVQRVAPDRISRYGVVKPLSGADTNALSVPIVDVVEKPAPHEAPSDLAVAARYSVTPDLFALLRNTPPSASGEVQLTDALRVSLQQNEKGVAVPLLPGEARHDIGGFDSYFKAFAAFALSDPGEGDGLRSYIERRFAARNEKDAGS